MNKLPIAKRVQVINMLVEGMSLREISRIADVSINTITKLLVDTGKACQKFHDETVHSLNSKIIKADEVWSFGFSKQKSVENNNREVECARNIGVWTAIDADSKIIVSYFFGERDAQTAYRFMCDVKSRLSNHVYLTTNGHTSYLTTVPDALGSKIDYAMLIKLYGNTRGSNASEGKYYSDDCTNFDQKGVVSKPDGNRSSTSDVKYQNLNMGRHSFSHLNNAFSKKIENHCYAIALHFVHYNFAKIHRALRVTPAMEAGLIKDIMSIEDIVKLASNH